MTAQTASASTVHHPFGSPSGPGLFRVKGLQLPAYIQNVAHALLRTGSAKDESTAIEIAVGVVKRWAAGVGAKGRRVHPDVQAAAARAVAEWEAARIRAHAHVNEDGGAMTLTWNGVQGIELGRVAPQGDNAGGQPAAKSSSSGSYDSLHPHVPAGSPNGGQFGTKGSGASKASQKKPVKAKAGKKAAAPKPAAKSAPKAPAKSTPKKITPPTVSGGPAAQKAQLRQQAAGDRAKAADVSARIHALSAAIHAAVKAAAGVKAAAATKTSATAAAATAVKAAATAPAAATTATTAAGTAVTSTATTAAKKAPTIAQMRTRRTALRSQRSSLLARAASLDAQAAAIRLAGDGDALELAFREVLTERIPPGKPEGGQFAARPPRLTRYDTPAQAAEVINGMERAQRASVRAAVLAPPGFSWADGDRLAVAR